MDDAKRERAKDTDSFLDGLAAYQTEFSKAKDPPNAERRASLDGVRQSPRLHRPSQAAVLDLSGSGSGPAVRRSPRHQRQAAARGHDDDDQ